MLLEPETTDCALFICLVLNSEIDNHRACLCTAIGVTANCNLTYISTDTYHNVSYKLLLSMLYKDLLADFLTKSSMQKHGATMDSGGIA